MAFDQQNRCINCSLLIPKSLRRYTLAQSSDALINLLQSWIFPTQLFPDSIICSECFNLLQSQVDTIKSEEICPAFGHQKVCFPCGKSILRVPRTYPVHQERAEWDVLLKNVPLHLVSRLERVCAACYSSATRQVKKQQHTSNRPASAHSPSNENCADDLPLSSPTPPPLLIAQTIQKGEPKITSSQYRRAASTSAHCVFVNCHRSQRLCIPSAIRDLVLCRHKLYIPPGARVCRHHLSNGLWKELSSQLKDFTGRQFDDIMAMMERAADNHLDFADIRMMSPHLCYYWLGMNSDQFYDLLNSVPDLADEVPNATIALCIYLVKLRTGDSNNRLATLFNIPRATLERWMAKARICLNNVTLPSESQILSF